MSKKNQKTSRNCFNKGILCTWESMCINFDNLDTTTFPEFDFNTIEIYPSPDESTNGRIQK